MFLLTITACFSMGQAAECRREVTLFETMRECVEIGTATVAYIRETETPDGVQLIFAGGTCERGRDA